MSLTQTYYLAHTARGKLSKEAAKSDHNLRFLVGHANLLDGLMLDLADAEREQESWFNQTVKASAKASEEPEQTTPKHIQWADTIPEEAVDDADFEDNDSESDDEEEISYAQPMAVQRKRPTTVTSMDINEDEDMEDDDDFEEDLALTRTSSNHLPDLLHESDSDSEDDSMPPSPPLPELKLSEKQRQAIATTSYYPSEKSDMAHLSPSDEDSFMQEGFFVPERRQPGLVSAISVY